MTKIRYLAFEGGGGKGQIYLGAIEALEQHLKDLKKKGHDRSLPPSNDLGVEGPGIVSPIHQHWQFDPIIDYRVPWNQRWVKGISGSSAGAITALMIALGMSSQEIDREINDWTRTLRVGPISNTVPVNGFETFFEDPNIEEYYRSSDNKTYTERYINELAPFIEPIILSGEPFFHIFKGILNLFVESENDPSLIEQRVLMTEDNLGLRVRKAKYLTGAITNRGMFPGLKVREYFSGLIKNQLLDKLPTEVLAKLRKYKGEHIKFSDFYNLTGVDLVIIATNISNRSSRYFSVGHTPNFPVAEAVSLSMTFPFVFRPGLITRYAVHNNRGGDYNDSYSGLYVDAGVLNNYPLHAFDNITLEQTKPVLNSEMLVPVASPYEYQPEFNHRVLGMRIGSATIPAYHEQHDFNFNNYDILSDFIGNLLSTLLVPGRQGQIRSKIEEDLTIYLEDRIKEYELQVLDFAGPGLDRRRNRPASAKNKDALIKAAFDSVRDRLLPS